MSEKQHVQNRFQFIPSLLYDTVLVAGGYPHPLVARSRGGKRHRIEPRGRPSVSRSASAGAGQTACCSMARKPSKPARRLVPAGAADGAMHELVVVYLRPGSAPVR